MKAILHASGSEPGLYPMTLTQPKQLVPIFDKPLIYYPLTVLMLAGVRNVLLTAPPRDLANFAALLSDGRQWGINISYAEQVRDGTEADSIVLAERFIGDRPCAMMSADTVLFGEGLGDVFTDALANLKGATVFVTEIGNRDPGNAMALAPGGQILNDADTASNAARLCLATGLQMFDASIVEVAKQISGATAARQQRQPLLEAYRAQGTLQAQALPRGVFWFDTATPHDMLEAATAVAMLERQHGYKVACPEEAALRLKLISIEDFERLIAARYSRNKYGEYLKSVLASL